MYTHSKHQKLSTFTIAARVDRITTSKDPEFERKEAYPDYSSLLIARTLTVTGVNIVRHGFAGAEGKLVSKRRSDYLMPLH